MEEKFVFKNQRFRKLCVSIMTVSMIIAAIYAILSLVNFENCANYPRFGCRMVLTLFFAIETALFSHRCSIYMEIGGDFALARRSASFMIVTLILSAIVEAYYISASAIGSGTMRAVYMCVIIVIACISMLPIIQFQYMDLHFMTMRLLVLLGIVSSLISFIIGFLIIGVNEIELYSAYGVLQTMSRVLDSLSPVYLINCLVGVVIYTMAHITFKREEKRNKKFLPENLAHDAFIDPDEIKQDEDDDYDEDLEYNSL